jgi:hypothetical protein
LTPVAAPRPQPSAPFVSRELNGAVLLEELDELRQAQVPSHHLADVVVGLRDLGGARVSEAVARLKQLAQGRFSGQPAVASLLVRWSARLKTEPDVPLLVGHFERLAVTATLVGALRRGAQRLQGGRA